MISLLARATAYALGLGITVVVVDTTPVDWHMLIKVGNVVALFLDTETANSSECGEIVYRFCEQYQRSLGIKFIVTEIPATLRASA